MVKGGKTRDKDSKVGGVVVLHAEVVHHQDEGNRARGVVEKTGGKGLVEVEGLKQRDESETSFSLYIVFFHEREKRKARQDFWEKKD